MAIFAIDLEVLAHQRKAALVVIKPGGFLPTALAVATGAVTAQTVLVFVIFLVTGVAIRAQFDAVQRLFMAGRAGCRTVLAVQVIWGIDIMVKSGWFPVLDTVTGFAFVAKLALVAFGAFVVFFVATDAGARGVFVDAALVATGAFGFKVFAQQRKMGAVVVKFDLFPGVLMVAIGAFCSQRGLVGVVLAVTANTSQRGLAVFFVRRMAFAALLPHVLALEHKISLGVVKFIGIQLNDLRFAALVVGVANVAGLRFLDTMKTGFGRHVSGNILVTPRAQARLGFAVKLDVALFAVILQFDVGGDDLARGQNRLYALCMGL